MMCTRRFIKRFIDLTVGLSLVTAFLPLLIVIAVFIKLDSRGPAFFIQKRIGKNGSTFNCIKFRTMVLGAENALGRLLEEDSTLKAEWEENFKLKSDPRITRAGKLLRKTSLDELPQLLNVIRGEMSLVGPRPRPLYEMAHNDANKFIFWVGLSMRPGMTGLWQVYGRNKVKFEDRLKMDALYVLNWSLMLDMRILFKTIGTVLHQKGAY